MIDFTTIDYLKSGNNRQQEAYIELKKLNIFDNLKKYNPLLAGTIPIEIDLPQSDLDIICYCKSHTEFSNQLFKFYEKQSGFKINHKNHKGIASTIAKFKTEKFDIEIFGQSIPSSQQNAYKHMLIEYKILKEKGLAFKTEILKLKSEGYSTEAAFAHLLGIKGNPFNELLKVEI
ncbi:MAG: DUF4269 domain-containing protein [Bacteroidales bacterium]|nr:DUF4269 domain-containing protein [Bacteroidales bacterium]